MEILFRLVDGQSNWRSGEEVPKEKSRVGGRSQTSNKWLYWASPPHPPPLPHFLPLRAWGQESSRLAGSACVCAYMCVCVFTCVCTLPVSAYCALKHKKMISGIFCGLNSMPLRLRQLVKDVQDEMVLGSPRSHSTSRKNTEKKRTVSGQTTAPLCVRFLAYSSGVSSPR